MDRVVVHDDEPVGDGGDARREGRRVGRGPLHRVDVLELGEAAQEGRGQHHAAVPPRAVDHQRDRGRAVGEVDQPEEVVLGGRVVVGRPELHARDALVGTEPEQVHDLADVGVLDAGHHRHLASRRSHARPDDVAPFLDRHRRELAGGSRHEQRAVTGPDAALDHRLDVRRGAVEVEREILVEGGRDCDDGPAQPAPGLLEAHSHLHRCDPVRRSRVWRRGGGSGRWCCDDRQSSSGTRLQRGRSRKASAASPTMIGSTGVSPGRSRPRSATLSVGGSVGTGAAVSRMSDGVGAGTAFRMAPAWLWAAASVSRGCGRRVQRRASGRRRGRRVGVGWGVGSGVGWGVGSGVGWAAGGGSATTTVTAAVASISGARVVGSDRGDVRGRGGEGRHAAVRPGFARLERAVAVIAIRVGDGRAAIVGQHDRNEWDVAGVQDLVGVLDGPTAARQAVGAGGLDDLDRGDERERRRHGCAGGRRQNGVVRVVAACRGGVHHKPRVEVRLRHDERRRAGERAAHGKGCGNGRRARDARDEIVGDGDIGESRAAVVRGDQRVVQLVADGGEARLGHGLGQAQVGCAGAGDGHAIGRADRLASRIGGAGGRGVRDRAGVDVGLGDGVLARADQALADAEGRGLDGRAVECGRQGIADRDRGEGGVAVVGRDDGVVQDLAGRGVRRLGHRLGQAQVRRSRVR